MAGCANVAPATETNAALHDIRHTCHWHRCGGPQISRNCSAHFQRHPFPITEQKKEHVGQAFSTSIKLPYERGHARRWKSMNGFKAP
jgi:hypothetical protein